MGRENYQGHATFAEIISHHIARETITRKDIELATRKSHATVHRWVTGETEPGMSELGHLIERLPVAVGQDLLGLLLAGSRFEAAICQTFEDLDANHDGKLDATDIGLHTAEATAQAGRLAASALTDAASAELISRSNAVRRAASAAATVATRAKR